jgi:L-threonylcarbamoyladenylate synthase
VHVPDTLALREFAVLDDDNAALLAVVFWPGPLTLVLPQVQYCQISELALAGHGTVAVRVPDNPVALDLMKALDRPIVAPSANRSGTYRRPPQNTCWRSRRSDRSDHRRRSDECRARIDHRVICRKADAVASGGTPREDIENVLRFPLATAEPSPGEAPLAPGMLASHYAPRTPLRLNACDVGPGEALLAFGADAPHAPHALNLSPSGDLIEAAANLFSYLRKLDACGARAIAVAPIPNEGLGEAINDRLARAAAPRT